MSPILPDPSAEHEVATLAATPLDYITTCDLPTPWATFRLHAFMDAQTGKEHLAMALGSFDDGAPVLMRMHSECLTGDALFSQRCDCGAQLEASLQKIAAEGRGVLLYLRQEGRGCWGMGFMPRRRPICGNTWMKKG